MTLTTPYSATFYVGDGKTKTFPYLFEEVSESFISVIVYNSLTGQSSTPTYIVDTDQKQVIFGDDTPAPTADETVCIYRNTPNIQDTPFRTLQGYDAKALENILSKIVAMIQEIKSNYFTTQVLQGDPWQLDLLTSADDGATVNIDYIAKKLVKGLYFKIVDGNLKVSADDSNYITMPKSVDVAEFRQKEVILPDLSVVYKLEYRVGNTWYDAGAIAEGKAEEAIRIAEEARDIATDAKDIAQDAKDIADTFDGRLSQAEQDASDAKSIAQDASDNVSAHIADKNNPHEVTKAQVGLGNVDNTADLDKPIIIKSDTIPTASADLVGKEYQYFGTTNGTYTHGFVYECIAESETDNLILFNPVGTGKLGFDYAHHSVYELFERIAAIEGGFAAEDVVSGSFTLDKVNELWSINGYDSNGDALFTNFTVSGTGDEYSFDAYGFVYIVPFPDDFEEGHEEAFSIVQDTHSTYSWVRVDVQPVTEIIDNVTSTSATAALSANQGKILNDRIDDVSGRGRFLSVWNCATGLAETNPPESPYTYKAGDYFLVGTVGSTNYRPDGSSYTIGVASTTVETDEVKVNDEYIYDGTTWKLQANSQREYTFSGIAGSPYDNTNLASALNSKADDSDLTAHVNNTSNPHSVTKAQVGLGNVDNTSDLNKPISTATQTALDLKADKSTTYTKTETDTLLSGKQDNIPDLATIRSGAALGATAVQPGDNVSELVNDAGYLTQHQTLADLGITATASEINVLDGITASTTELNYTDGVTSNIQTQLNSKQATISDLATIRSNAQAGKSASDTIATYGDIVTHDVAEFATAAQGAKADMALQAGDNVSELVNDAGYLVMGDLTNFVTKNTAQTISGLKTFSADITLSGTTSIKNTTNGVSYTMLYRDASGIHVGTSTQALLLAGSNARPKFNNNDIAMLSDIPTAVSQLTNDTGFITNAVNDLQNYTLTSDLATVATSGSYNDLSDKPTIGNATLTIQKNGTTIDTFTANATSNKTIDIAVPTKTSDITNDSDYQNSTQVATAISTHNTSTTAHSNQFNAITDKIPAEASSSNKLADKAFVNSSIATNTANFIGTFNSVAELEAYSGTVTNNDYAFVIVTDSAGNTAYDRYKYTTATTPASWVFEYELNNSSFTAAQWAAINSGANTTNIGQIATNTTTISNHIGNTSNPHQVTKAQVGLGNVDNTSDLAKPISTATQTALNAKANIADLATVATSGSYNDLSDKPTIPTVNNATLTIQKNGTTVQTFTANQSTNATANISVPTKTSDITNDSGFITSSALAPYALSADLATVATSGDYNDLSNKPTIPTVGNGTITITQGGVSKGTFTTNQSGNTTIALDAGGGGGGAVDSVNGKTGVVVLTATDVGALPDSTVIPDAQIQSDWNQADNTKVDFIKNKPTKSTVAGLGMPSDTWESLTVGASGTIYTAPYNGYFCLWVSGSTGAAGLFHVDSNDNDVGGVVTSNNWPKVLYPVRKGQRIRIYYGGTVERFVFIYAQGEI